MNINFLQDKSKRTSLLAISLCVLGGIIFYTQVSGFFTKKETFQKAEMVVFNEDNICDKLDLLERKAEYGDVKLQMKLFEIYGEQCKDIPNANLKKNLWILKAAQEENYALAQYKLSLLYEFGEGLPRNYMEALKWLKLSAESGYPAAEYELAKRYKEGYDEYITADLNLYLYWISQAAKHGNEQAAAELGAIYEAGEIVPQSYTDAYTWYSLATYSNATKLNELENMISADQVKEAQRRAVVIQRDILKFVNDNKNLF